MKALVKSKREAGLWMEDVPRPQVGNHDVLIKVDRTGICGTDGHIWNWDEWARDNIPVPLVVGHEFVGEIVEVGSEVSDFQPGQIASGEGHVVCGHCRNCKAGKRQLCEHSVSVGVSRPGAFAEYIAIPKTNVWVHPADIDREVASIFDPFGNAVHTALQFDLLGEDILITGAGPIGIMAAAVCRHAGARYVVITDINPYRLELAKKMRVTRAMDVRRESIEDVQKELGMAAGFDVGLEVSGNPDALNDMIDNMRHGGKISILGIPEKDFVIDWSKVIFNMLTLKGIYGREIYETWYKMKVMVQGGLDIKPVITHRYDAENYEEAFATMQSGQCGKVILRWSKD